MARRKKKGFDSSEIKNWVMFIFALGLLYGMFRRGDKLNAWWTLIIGAMLSLTTLMVAVENIMTMFKRGDNNGRDDGSTGESSTERVQRILGQGEEEAQPPGRTERRSRLWQRGRHHQGEVAAGWDAHLLHLGGTDPSPVQ